MKKLILAVALVAGCADGCADGIQIDYLPGQDAALNMIADVYGMEVAEIPPIAWIRGDDLNCTGQFGFGWREDGFCVDGSHQEPSLLGGPELIKVAMYAGRSWGDNALAHEVCHVFKLRTAGDADGGHHGPCFNDPGEDGGNIHGLTGIGMDALRALGVAWDGSN